MLINDENLYYIGGVVRDEILGVSSFDIDYCYEGNALEFAKDLNIIKSNPSLGTVRILNDNVEIDIASTRTESYPNPGHLPVVNKIGCSLKEDLMRRDFTINALAKNSITGEIIDYFNGINDIKNKKLRILHDNSFIDDPTRIVRALKFSIRFGFELDEKTRMLQEEYLNNVNYDISYHRLKKELKETFSLNKVLAYNLFVKQGIYKLLGENQITPEIDNDIENLIYRYKPKHTWLVYLGCFDLSKLMLDSEEQKIVSSFKDIQENLPADDIEIYKMFNNKPLETILLYAVFVKKDIALRYLDVLSMINITIKGEDLLNLGIKKGKIYNEIFEYILNQKILSPTLNKEEELELVKKNFL